MIQKNNNIEKAKIETAFLNAESIKLLHVYRELNNKYDKEKEKVLQYWRKTGIMEKLINLNKLVDEYEKEDLLHKEFLELTVNQKNDELKLFLTFGNNKEIILNFGKNNNNDGKYESRTIDLNNEYMVFYQLSSLMRNYPITARMLINALNSNILEKEITDLIVFFADNDIDNGKTEERIEELREELETVKNFLK